MPKNDNHKQRIDFNDTLMDILMKMSEGNPGAVHVLTQLLNDKNDPDSFCGSLGSLLSLDALGIYGSNIWVLFKNVCGQNILNVVTLLRAVQLGILPERDLWTCIDNNAPLDCEQILTMVREELPRFGNSESQPA